MFNFEDDNKLIRSGFERELMKPAILQLYDIVAELADDYEATGNIGSVWGHFELIAKGLQDVNPDLADSWFDASSFYKGVDLKIQNIILGVVMELNKYIEGVKGEEAKLQNALNETNAVTKNLLDELDSI